MVFLKSSCTVLLFRLVVYFHIFEGLALKLDNKPTGAILWKNSAFEKAAIVHADQALDRSRFLMNLIPKYCLPRKIKLLFQALIHRENQILRLVLSLSRLYGVVNT